MKNYEFRLHHSSGKTTRIVLLGNDKREAEQKIAKFYPAVAEAKSYVFLQVIELQYSSKRRNY
jgi:hypothetical protein